MIKINIHEAKTHLSRYLKLLANGERILLCRRNIPIAEIVPIRSEEKNAPRPFGLARGEFSVAEEFFAPLPTGMLKAFSGEGDEASS